jgi:hypothetical protein
LVGGAKRTVSISEKDEQEGARRIAVSACSHLNGGEVGHAIPIEVGGLGHKPSWRHRTGREEAAIAAAEGDVAVRGKVEFAIAIEVGDGGWDRPENASENGRREGCLT